MAEMQVQLSLVDDFTSAMESAISTLNDFQSNVESVGSALDDINPSTLDDVSNAANDASDSLKETSNSAEETGGSMENASGSTDLLNAAMSGLMGLGVAAWFEEIITAAGEYQDSITRLTLVSGEGLAGWESDINHMKDVTGRSAGSIRQHITNMSLAGVQSHEIISQSFDAIAGAAFRTGTPIEQLDTTFKSVVANGRVGRNTLMQFGLTTDDIGMSTADLTKKLQGMTPEMRAAYLTDLIGKKDMKQANEDYKKSWESVLDKLGAAWDYLNRIFGQLVIPIVIPAIEGMTKALKDFADWLDKTDPTLKSILGTLILIGGGAAMLIPVVQGAKLLYNTFSDVKRAIIGVLEKLGILNATPCNPKNCVTKQETVGGPGLMSKLGLASSATGVAGMGAGTFALGGLISSAAAGAAATGGGYIQQTIGKGLGLGQGQIDMANFASSIPGVGAGNLMGSMAAGKQVSPVDFLVASIPGLTVFKGTWETIFDMLPNSVKDAVGGVGKQLDKMKDSIGKTWSKISSNTTKVWDTIKDTVTRMVGILKTNVTNIFNSLKLIVTTIWNTIKNTAFTIWNTLKSGVVNIVNTLKTTVVNIVGQIKQGVINGFNAIIGPAGSAWNSIKSAVSGPINTIIGWINSLRGAIGLSAASAISQGTNAAVKNAGSPSFGTPRIAPSSSLPSIPSLSAGPLPSTLTPQNARIMLSQLLSRTGNDGCSTCGSAGGLIPTIEGNVSNWVGAIKNNAWNLGSRIFGPGLDLDSAWNTFMSYADALFSNFHYEFYFGGHKSNAQTYGDKGGNCVDMSELLNAIAGAFGLSAGLGSGTWDGIGHVFSVINGKKFDAVGKVNRGSFFNYPASGPAPRGWGNQKTEINLNVDLRNVPSGVNKAELRKYLHGALNDSKVVDRILRSMERNKGRTNRALG